MASTAHSGTDGPGRPVVLVGIDGSDPSRAALAWAVTYAEEVGATVRAVAVWQQPSAIGQAEWFPEPEYERAAQAWLDETLTGLPDGAHDGVESLVARGDPGDTLLEHARDAGVLVLGNSRRGGVAGALLGSVGLHCAHHAACPLVLVAAP
jgi:nucleotide-binding universal stress UspA family protein